MFYLVTTDYSQKGDFSDSSTELFKSYKEGKKVIGEPQYVRSFGVKKIRKYQKMIAYDKNDTSH